MTTHATLTTVLVTSLVTTGAVAAAYSGYSVSKPKTETVKVVTVTATPSATPTVKPTTEPTVKQSPTPLPKFPTPTTILKSSTVVR